MTQTDIETPDWDASHLAVHREDLPGDDGKGELHLLRHASYPFQARIPDDPSKLFEALQTVANAYLLKVGKLDAALENARKLAAAGDPNGFGWLDISWDEADGLEDPRGSFSVRRTDKNGQLEPERSIVLLAANRWVFKPDGARAEGFMVGLRVVMHLDAPAVGILRVTIAGLSACRLARAKPAPARIRPLVREGFLSQAIALVTNALGFVANAVQLHAFEVIEPHTLRLIGTGARQCGEEELQELRAYQWALNIRRVDPHANPPVLAIVGVPRVVRQVSDGNGAAAVAGGQKRVPASVFLRDAASAGKAETLVERRVTRDKLQLDRWRQQVEMPLALPTQLKDPLGRYEVMQSQVADRHNKPHDVQSVNLRLLELRSDGLAAVHGARRAQEFFELMTDFGLLPKAYFKFAKLPLRIRHRASFDARPDGRAVNAQVAPDATPLGYLSEYDEALRPRLQVRFGAATLRHREVLTNDQGKDTAQPLGLAADPRWAWHEFGHVLSYAATGALEFHFAHSVGDALAAVLHDARSELARSSCRGVTFPWVPTGRRHDRKAAAGWCWCGRRNGMRRAPLSDPPLLYKGYIEEQLLSSSIFTLYQAIGGETFGGRRDLDEATRLRAARSCAYLVMRATVLLGPSGLVPARSADAFVSALVDADIGTRGGPLPGGHPGGSVHKVVRWAFEQQGLFATAAADQDVDGAGKAPAVDLWIADQRPQGDGGYAPVPLHWKVEPQPWHADRAALRVVSRKLLVTVGNRGRRASTVMTVQAWIAPATKGLLRWQCLGAVSAGGIPAGGRTEIAIRIGSGLPAKAYYVLAEATCAEDRSNLDPAAALPCSGIQPPATAADVMQLVANDNNLALRVSTLKRTSATQPARDGGRALASAARSSVAGVSVLRHRTAPR